MAVETQTVPLHRSVRADGELANLAQALEQGATAAGGPWSTQVRELLRDELGAAEVLLTTSCTAALELGAALLDLQPGDTVIVPSFTFPSTAAAFLRAGAQVRFCDIETTTLGLDPRALARLMDDSVAAVAVVHYAGSACDLAEIQAVLARWPRARLVEDAAHGLFGTWADRSLGTVGTLGTVSFHQTKTFSCGEGGALLLGPDIDPERAWTLWDKGTDRRAFLAGRATAYTWQEVGSSFGLADLLAAILAAQLDQRVPWIERRRRAASRYLQALRPHAAELGLGLLEPVAAPGSAAHLFPVLLPAGMNRTQVIRQLHGAGVASAFHFMPLHSSPAGQRADPGAACPVTDDVAARLLRLPLDSVTTEAEVDRAAAALLAALAPRRRA